MTELSKRYYQKQKIKLMARMSILVIFPLCLLALPAYTFDNGQYTICISKLITGKDCWGCGMSRACQHLIHMDFQGALFYNKLSFIVLPILMGLMIASFLKDYRRLKSVNAQLQSTDHTHQAGS
ncbi:MAG: DUF2752 domain-containing protein [Chitinophagaceae bacterium]